MHQRIAEYGGGIDAEQSIGEHAESATNGSFTVTERIVGEAEAWGGDDGRRVDQGARIAFVNGCYLHAIQRIAGVGRNETD